MELYIFGILISIIVLLLILTFSPMPFAGKLNVQKKGPYDLNKNTTIFSSNTDFVKSSSTTFQGFFYLEQLQKTGIITPCSSTDLTKPNCNTGRYSLCACDATDCSKCYHKEYIPLVNFNDICTLELLGAPDGGRQNRASVQFTMKTQSSGDIIDSSDNRLNPEKSPADASGSSTTISDVYIETFVLPPIPFQKWIMITISREGRRFDVYYNKTLMLSKQASAVLYGSPTSDNIIVGNNKLHGSCAFFSIYNTIQSAIAISKQYGSLINTRGSPVLDENPPTLGLTKGNLSIGVPSLCPSGDCIQSPSNPPASPLYEWSSSYA